MAARRWLITGGSGQVGGALARRTRAEGIDAITPNRSALDLSNAGSVRASVRDSSFDLIVSCGAYTAVDKAESEATLAGRVNALAPTIVAEEAARRGIPIIHLSTDYVFDGTKPTLYREDDPIAPQSVYGRTKAEGEAGVMAANPHHAIIRTAWVLSAGGQNFLNTMLRLAETRDRLGVVGDQLGCPTSADDLATALLAIGKAGVETSGIWHVVNSGEASWFELATHIFARAAERGRAVPQLDRITTADYPTPAKRPANSRLCTDKFQSDFNMSLPDWRDAVDAILAERLGQH